MSDDLDARIAQLQGLIGDDETAQRAQAAPVGFGRPQQGSVFNQGSQAGTTTGQQGPGGEGAGSAPPRFAKDADERSIFVGNLPKVDETAEEVANLFVHCGVINKVTLLRDRNTQALKGTAYIEFATHEATGKALDTMQNAVFRGQNQLIVTKKRSKFDEARQAGGRGRGRGRGAGDPMAMMMQAFATIAGAAGGGRGGGRGRGRARGRGNFSGGGGGGGGNFGGGGGNFGGGGGGGNFGGPPPAFGNQ